MTSDNPFVELVGHDRRTQHLTRWDARWRPGSECYGGMGGAPDSGWPALCGEVGLKVSDLKPRDQLRPCGACTAAVSDEFRPGRRSHLKSGIREQKDVSA